jgi:hypothetical protein
LAVGLFPVRRPRAELVPEPPEVEVEVAVERAARRDLEGVRVVALVDSGLRAEARPESCAVRLEGLAEEIQALAPAGLVVTVDARGRGPGDHLLPSKVDTLGGVIMKAASDRIRVRVRRASEGEGGR